MEQKTNLISILVTGSNKGIGYGIIKKLLENQTNSSNWLYKIIFTSRDVKKGEETINELNKNFGDLKKNLIFKQLDITNEDSINDTISFVKKEFGKIDILLNNAGVAFKGQVFDTSVFDVTFATNFYATVNFTEKFLENDIIKDNGKIIIIGSMSGNCKKLGKDLLKEFQDKNMKKEKLYELAGRFRDSIDKGNNIELGWGSNIYSVSKMLINKYASIVGNREEILNKNIQVYSCCPGWVRTDMGGPRAQRSLDEGVVCPVYLIELEHKLNKEFQGKFFEDCKVSDIGI